MMNIKKAFNNYYFYLVTRELKPIYNSIEPTNKDWKNCNLFILWSINILLSIRIFLKKEAWSSKRFNNYNSNKLHSRI